MDGCVLKLVSYLLDLESATTCSFRALQGGFVIESLSKYAALQKFVEDFVIISSLYCIYRVSWVVRSSREVQRGFE